MPVPETNGEEWDRLEPSSALDTLVDLVLHGEFGGELDSERRAKDGLELRAAALGVFQNFVQREEIAEAIIQAMISPPGSVVPVTPLLFALIQPHAAPLRTIAVTSTHFACLLFAHLLRASPRSKQLALSVVPAPAPSSAQAQGSFFVPADGGPPPAPAEEPEEEADESQTLLQILSENLSLAFLARGRADTSELEAREWDRLLVGYLTLLIQWLWEHPRAVREFLEAGALGVLVEPVNQMSDANAFVPGLCVFLLGVLYEFNREPGEITRETIFDIVVRLGMDILAGRVTHLRDDDRFKAVGPDNLVLPVPSAPSHIHQGPGHAAKPDIEEGEIWLDWAFVDFWKSNYYTIQKAFSTYPDAPPPSSDSTMMIASLKDVIRRQAAEIDALKSQLDSLSTSHAQQAQQEPQIADDREALLDQISSLSAEVQSAEEKRREVEKEQEDLLVLLDELNSKRRRDKARMREAGLEVSEDEGDDEGEEDE